MALRQADPIPSPVDGRGQASGVRPDGGARTGWNPRNPRTDNNLYPVEQKGNADATAGPPPSNGGRLCSTIAATTITVADGCIRPSTCLNPRLLTLTGGRPVFLITCRGHHNCVQPPMAKAILLFTKL